MTAELKLMVLPCDETIVKRLTDLLALAAEGRVRALGFAAIMQDGDVQTCIVNEGVNYFTMLGALERLKSRYHNTVMDGD